MASYLLDTHTLIWWWLQDSALSDAARAVIEDEDNTVFVSAVTAFEIGQKVRVGKLAVLQPIVDDYLGAIAADEFGLLPLDPRHALEAGLMPGAHRDPFDRMIAAQAILDRHTVVTRNPAIAAFGCKVLW